MLIKITTKFTLDPTQPQGKKNLNLLLVAAGIRSQIEMRSLQKENRKWSVTFFLERPEFWGDDLKFLKEDLNSLVILHKGVAEPMSNLFHLEVI